MYKIQALLTRRPDISHQQFDKHWHSPHGDPLTLNIGVIRHLVQNSRLTEVDDLITSSYDGIPQVWFETLDDALGLQADPAYAEADADQEHFMDREKLAFLLLQEEAVDGEVGPGDGKGVNLMLCVKRRDGLSQAEFHDGWVSAEDADRGRALGARRQICSAAIVENYAEGAEPVYDGIRELFFEDLDALRKAPTEDPEAWAALTAPADADPDKSAVYIAEQRRLR
jgi:hypothetical protein